MPTVAEIRSQRRRQVLLARSRRNTLIERRLANPRVRKAVTKEIVEDALSGYRRAAARFFKLAEEETRDLVAGEAQHLGARVGVHAGATPQAQAEGLGLKVAIVGSRDYPHREEVAGFVYALKANYPNTIVISGGRGNVDTTAERVARDLDLDLISYRPVEYDLTPGEFGITTVVFGERAQALVDRRPAVSPRYPTFGLAAFGRNIWIVEDADRLVAFWDGMSKGTANDIDLARSKGIPISIKRPGVPMHQIS